MKATQSGGRETMIRYYEKHRPPRRRSFFAKFSGECQKAEFNQRYGLTLPERQQQADGRADGDGRGRTRHNYEKHHPSCFFS